MAVIGCAVSIEALKSWWDVVTKDGASRYILYHGKILRGNGNTGAKTLQSDTEDLTPEEAWETIEKFLLSQNGGSYTLLVKEMGKETGPRQYVDLPSGAAGSSAMGGGIAGFNDLLNMKMEIYDLRRQLEEKQDTPTFWERALPPEMIQDIAGACLPLIQGFIASRAGIPAVNGGQVTDNSEIQDIQKSLARIAGAIEPGDLAKIADIAETQPGIIPQVLAHLKAVNE